MAILATTPVTVTPRKRTVAAIVRMIDAAVTGDNITSLELAGMILETVEKNMRDTRIAANDFTVHNAICRELDDYARRSDDDRDVSAHGYHILEDFKDEFEKAWAGT
jgi:hypothetical protein